MAERAKPHLTLGGIRCDVGQLVRVRGDVASDFDRRFRGGVVPSLRDRRAALITYATVIGWKRRVQDEYLRSLFHKKMTTGDHFGRMIRPLPLESNRGLHKRLRLAPILLA